MKDFIKKNGAWLLTIFLVVLALSTMISITSIFATLAALLILPIKKWQEIIKKYVKEKSNQ